MTTVSSEVVTPIVVSGPATIERPEGEVLFSKEWGENPGQLGYDTWEQGAPSHNPIELAISPDESTIAILDYANTRAELFTLDGTLIRAIPIPSTSLLADIAYDKRGRLYVLAGNELFELPAAPDGNVVTNDTYPSDAFPYELRWDDNDVAYQLVFGDPTRVSLLITDSSTKSVREVPITSAELPLDDCRILGYDYSGNCYVMIRIYREHWQGTESWCYVGVSPQGEYLGQIRLPLDCWAGGGVTVTPSGKILELRSTEAGVIVAEYGLE